MIGSSTRHLNLLYIFSPFGFTTPWEGDWPNSYYSLSAVSVVKLWAPFPSPSPLTPFSPSIFHSFVDTDDRVGFVSLVSPVCLFSLLLRSPSLSLPPSFSPCVYIFTATISSREIGYAKVLLSKENTRQTRQRCRGRVPSAFMLYVQKGYIIPRHVHRGKFMQPGPHLFDHPCCPNGRRTTTVTITWVAFLSDSQRRGRRDWSEGYRPNLREASSTADADGRSQKKEKGEGERKGEGGR